MRRACIPLLVALCLVAGCRRRSTGPSQDYETAATLYQQLYVTLLDDAYGDARMDEVVAGLKRVDPGSIDLQAARDLLGTIDRGRAELAKQRAERAKRTEGVTVPKPVQIDPSAVLAMSRGARGVEADPTGTGASISELNQRYGGCLVSDQGFREQGTGKAGTVYKLAPYSACRDKLPGFVGQAVMVIDGLIYRRIPLSEAEPAPTPDAGPRAVPDGGMGPRTAAPEPAIPPGARLVGVDPDGTRHYATPPVYPGAPLPGAVPPPRNPDSLPDSTPPPTASTEGSQPPSSG
jgi:hypothetical protein